MTITFGPKNAKEAKIFAEEQFRVDVQHAIQAAMNAADASRENLAGRLGWSVERVNRIFEDECDLSVRELGQISHALGVQWVCKLR